MKFKLYIFIYKYIKKIYKAHVNTTLQSPQDLSSYKGSKTKKYTITALGKHLGLQSSKCQKATSPQISPS